jgi:uncharacterized membrane-anchored protein
VNPPRETAPARRPKAAKVPEITLLFWVIKILTTGMGEAASDYLGGLSLALAGVIGVGGFAVALWLQFSVDRYIAPVYWFAVAMVAIFGTMAADGLHVGLALPYAFSTLFYAVAVGVVFFLWHRSEGTLSIHSIVTRRRETYYWITVLASFALGTAAGDWTATSLNLGFLPSGILFAAVFAVPAIGWWRFGLNPVLGFWFAYVVTRPLGASFADWLAKPHSVAGGRDLGDGAVAAVSAAAIILLVLSVTILPASGGIARRRPHRRGPVAAHQGHPGDHQAEGDGEREARAAAGDGIVERRGAEDHRQQRR